ncbi:helix-turn-helix domain-containing protein [Propylenella binzhouense]|uniref:XRE family transcriptional regulator n=1 Tax=Propylenella binzhouense TaxID=2555902 RepID=A0A964T0U6_9HYPH|nr:XRE family transcriptional regulator [Propylenella binzhouense]MYZ46245.1 XRE family transcriptional regulator [Propylenella binzhouense]
MAPPKKQATEESIGARLREWRTGKGMTLSTVSAQTGVASSTLSKIENGQVSASYYTLKKICDGLEIPIEEIINPGHKSFAPGRRVVTRLGEGPIYRSNQYVYETHSTELSRKEMIPMIMTVLARSPDEFEDWNKHDGEEFVLVLEGEVDIYTEFYAAVTLTKGESMYFDSSMGHKYCSRSEEPAKIVSVCYDPQAHQHIDMADYFAKGRLNVMLDE